MGAAPGCPSIVIVCEAFVRFDQKTTSPASTSCGSGSSVMIPDDSEMTMDQSGMENLLSLFFQEWTPDCPAMDGKPTSIVDLLTDIRKYRNRQVMKSSLPVSERHLDQPPVFQFHDAV